MHTGGCLEFIDPLGPGGGPYRADSGLSLTGWRCPTGTRGPSAITGGQTANRQPPPRAVWGGGGGMARDGGGCWRLPCDGGGGSVMAGAIALWWLRSPCGGWCRWGVPVVGCLVGAGVLMPSAPSSCIPAQPKPGIRPAQNTGESEGNPRGNHRGNRRGNPHPRGSFF